MAFFSVHLNKGFYMIFVLNYLWPYIAIYIHFQRI